MEKRYVLALVLMVAVMFGWSWFYGRKLPKPEQTTEQVTEQSREALPPSPDSSSSSSESTFDAPQSAQVESPSRPRQPVRESQTVRVETGKYHIIFSVGRFAYAHEWALKEYPDRSGVDQSLFNLIPATAQNCLSVHFFNPGLTADAMDTFWETDKNRTYSDRSKVARYPYVYQTDWRKPQGPQAIYVFIMIVITLTSN